MTYASNLEDLLDSAHNIRLPVLLPSDFAAYVNGVVNESQVASQLPAAPVLELAVPGQTEILDVTEGLYLWTIGSPLMWQQLDRRIDE